MPRKTDVDEKSKVEWTKRWDIVTGCTKISPGCNNCYAERRVIKLKGMSDPLYANGFDLTIHEDELVKPFFWKQPEMVLVASMSDLFHEDVPFSFIQGAFCVMEQSPMHTFLILTKRSERLAAVADSLDWPLNVWIGVTIESDDYCFRADHLRETGAKTKVISLQPLLSSVPSLDLKDIDWVIMGGERGPGARPYEECWSNPVKDACFLHNIPLSVSKHPKLEDCMSNGMPQPNTSCDEEHFSRFSWQIKGLEEYAGGFLYARNCIDSAIEQFRSAERFSRETRKRNHLIESVWDFPGWPRRDGESPLVIDHTERMISHCSSHLAFACHGASRIERIDSYLDANRRIISQILHPDSGYQEERRAYETLAYGTEALVGKCLELIGVAFPFSLCCYVELGHRYRRSVFRYGTHMCELLELLLNLRFFRLSYSDQALLRVYQFAIEKSTPFYWE